MKFVFPLPHMLRLKAMMQPWEPTVTGPDQTRMAKCADRWGYDMIAIPEHLVIPAEHVDLSGPHYLHSTVAQAHIAGATEHIAINSCVSRLRTMGDRRDRAERPLAVPQDFSSR